MPDTIYLPQSDRLIVFLSSEIIHKIHLPGG